MKRICLLFILAGLMVATEAKEKKEPVVMTVAGKEVPLTEFVFMAKQGNGVDFKDKQSVAEFVELYKLLKLKVADAEALTIHQAVKFKQELESLTVQLQASYLTDKSGEDSALHVIYERTKIIPSVQHIFFRYSEELLSDSRDMEDLYQGSRLVTRDTVALYAEALAAWQRINNGESFAEVGQSLANDSSVFYRVFDQVFPLRFPKVMEDCIFTLQPGDVSPPVRSSLGFSLFKSDHIVPNPGKVRIAHILSAFPSREPTAEEIAEARERSEAIYQQVMAGADFSELAKAFSDDTVYAKVGGLLSEIEMGSGLLAPLEKAAFAFDEIGDVSKPVQTSLGFHVLKLVDRKREIPFEEKASSIFEAMKQTEHIFDLYRGFVEKTKRRHDYTFFPEAYKELQRLADEYFPLDSNFLNRAMTMEKTLFRVDSIDFTQAFFIDYLEKSSKTAQIYSLDYMQDIYNFFEYEILKEVERRSLERDYPDFNLTMQSYYDGTLLFEISNKRIWSQPPEEQAQLEAEWIKELNEKYPVTINWKAIKKIKK